MVAGDIDNPTDNLFKLAYVFADAARQAEDAGNLKAVGSNIAVPAGTDLKKQTSCSTRQSHWRKK
ncbi:MAG: hypothetical protein ACI82A_004202 [Candidatus Azotimanducaceae bacterium]